MQSNLPPSRMSSDGGASDPKAAAVEQALEDLDAAIPDEVAFIKALTKAIPTLYLLFCEGRTHQQNLVERALSPSDPRDVDKPPSSNVDLDDEIPF